MKFGKYEVEERTHPVGSGLQCLKFFPNGYGASIVRFTIGGRSGSYGSAQGLYELAVLIGNKEDGWDLTYDTPITNDVIGYLSEGEVGDHLEQIEGLPHSSTGSANK